MLKILLSGINGVNHREPKMTIELDRTLETGWEPQDREEAVISARRVVAFHPGAKLRERAERGSEEEGG